MKKLNKLKKILFWNLIAKCPKFIRERIIRSRFEVSYDLDPEIIFKQATTKDEIEQALNLVYESYVDLNYIDTNADQLHLTKYLTLPTTAILVIKLKEEVIGTMSIVLDSSLGLPVETTWDIDEYKKNGMNIAEISALTIGKSIKNHKGSLLLPLSKFMIAFCTDILKVDTIIIATIFEVEPFYTDLLLFTKIPDSRGQKHDLVKGTKATCCFLELNDPVKRNSHKAYAHKNKKNNLHHYFFECELPNIKLPKKMLSVQAQLKEKNSAMLDLIKEKPHLFFQFGETDRLVISNLESSQQFFSLCKGTINDRQDPRLVTMIKGRIEKKNLNVSIPVNIADVSERGLKIKLFSNEIDLKVDDEILIKIDKNLFTLSFFAKVMWINKDNVFGCMIQKESKYIWHNLYQILWEEVQGNREDYKKEG